MRLRLGRPRSALVVAPHPDDEVIGAFGLIRALLRRGTRVRILVVTDGAASHPGSVRWHRAKLIAARRRESRIALRRLGLAADALGFLDLPDGALSNDQRRCDRALARTIGRQRGLDLLVGPSLDDAHPDHRAVARALGRSRFAGRRLAYRVWPPIRTDGCARTLPSGHTATMKRSLVRCYRTQMGAIADDPRGFAIARHELAAFTHPVERYQTVRR